VGIKIIPYLLLLEEVNWYYFSNLLPLEGGGLRWGDT
jgi:hypothetical protein